MVQSSEKAAFEISHQRDNGHCFFLACGNSDTLYCLSKNKPVLPLVKFVDPSEMIMRYQATQDMMSCLYHTHDELTKPPGDFGKDEPVQVHHTDCLQLPVLRSTAFGWTRRKGNRRRFDMGERTSWFLTAVNAAIIRSFQARVILILSFGDDNRHIYGLLHYLSKNGY